MWWLRAWLCAWAFGAATPAFAAPAGTDAKSLLSFGARCDGVSDDSLAIQAAEISGAPITIPAGRVCNAPAIYPSTLVGIWRGPGRIRTSDGDLNAPLLTVLSAPPRRGDPSSILTAFNGDVSHLLQAGAQYVTGAGTLGMPRNYLIIPEASMTMDVSFNQSGYNQNPAGGGGRTGLFTHYDSTDNYGQGDDTTYGCFNMVAGSPVAGTNPRENNFLAGPEVGCLGGQEGAAGNGSYMEFLGDMNLSDGGYDVAAAGIVLNLFRSDAAEAVGSNWYGARFASMGSSPADLGVQIAGRFAAGLDMSELVMGDYRLAKLELRNGGTGYKAGDVLTVQGGRLATGAGPTRIAVVAVGGGAVTAFAVAASGLYAAPPGAVLDVTGGAGGGARFTGLYTADNAVLLPQAGGYIQPGAGPAGQPASVLQPGDVTRLGILPGGATLATAAAPDSGAALATPGSNDVVAGGGNAVTGRNNVLLGQNLDDLGQNNAIFTGSGGAQQEAVILRGSTATRVRLSSDGQPAGAANSISLPPNSAAAVAWDCAAHDASRPADNAAWTGRHGFIFRTGGLGPYAGAGATPTPPDFGAAGATVTVAADRALNNLAFTYAAPPGGDTWNIACAVTVLEAR